jgi:uncharacterized protein (TIGR02145 family)
VKLLDATGAFNWCAYGSGAPPRAVLQPDGSYSLKGTPPFTFTYNAGASTTTNGDTFNLGCITAITDLTGNPAGSVDKPNITAVTSPAICYNKTANLTATISGGTTTAMTYTWNIGGTGSTTTGATKTTSALTATTTYTVQARNAAGCTSTVSNTGTITVRPNFTAGSITTASGITTAGTNPNKTIASSTPASGGDGSITYQWRRSGDSNATYDYNASTYPIGNYAANYSAVGTYKINRYAHDATCNTGWVASTGTYTLTVAIAPPPGAGTKTWTCGTQTWSSAVKATMSACNYLNANNGYGYYYSWYCVRDYPTSLCPSPWRVPTTADIYALSSCMNDALATEMGKAGMVAANNNVEDEGRAFTLLGSETTNCPYALGCHTCYIWYSAVENAVLACDKFFCRVVHCVK